MANNVNYTHYLYIEITEPAFVHSQTFQNYSGRPVGTNEPKNQEPAGATPPHDSKRSNQKLYFNTKILQKMYNENLTEGVQKVADALEVFKSRHEGRQNTIETQMKEIKEDVAIMKDGGSTGGYSRKSLGQLAVEALTEAGLDSSLQKGARKTVVINKTVGTMSTGNVIPVGSNSIPFTLSDAESGLTRIVRRRPWILELANVSSTTGMYVQWSEQENPDGAAAETSEGSEKNQIDFDWVEKSKKVEKVTAYTKVSKEALNDVPSLKNEIDNELQETVMLAVDTYLLSGDGTTPTLDGILNQATAYSAGVFAGTVTDPNNFDVLRTAVAQVAGNNFNPTAIVLNPSDVATMDLSKSTTDGHYVLPPFKGVSGMSVSGVIVIENNGVAAGDFLVGDFSKLNIRVREGFTIDVGFEGSDFIKNLVTILGEIRLASYIKNVHKKAFVFGDFTTAIDALVTS